MAQDQDLPQFCVVTYFNPKFAGYASWTSLFWWRGDELMQQSILLTGRPEHPDEGLVDRQRARPLRNGARRLPGARATRARVRSACCGCRAQAEFWGAVQYAGKTIDLGGAGLARLVDLDNDGVPELAQWTTSESDPRFVRTRTCRRCSRSASIAAPTTASACSTGAPSRRRSRPSCCSCARSGAVRPRSRARWSRRRRSTPRRRTLKLGTFHAPGSWRARVRAGRALGRVDALPVRRAAASRPGHRGAHEGGRGPLAGRRPDRARARPVRATRPASRPATKPTRRSGDGRQVIRAPFDRTRAASPDRDRLAGACGIALLLAGCGSNRIDPPRDEGDIAEQPAVEPDSLASWAQRARDGWASGDSMRADAAGALAREAFQAAWAQAADALDAAHDATTSERLPTVDKGASPGPGEVAANLARVGLAADVVVADGPADGVAGDRLRSGRLLEREHRVLGVARSAYDRRRADRADAAAARAGAHALRARRRGRAPDLEGGRGRRTRFRVGPAARRAAASRSRSPRARRARPPRGP